MTREEVYNMVHELDPELAIKLDTKGVVNILPVSVAASIMPKHQHIARSVSEPDFQEDLNVISYENQGIRMIKPKTELISSGKRKESNRMNSVNKQIKAITSTIPTLEPIAGKILGNQFRQLMSIFSHKMLAISSIAAGSGILLQIIFSQYARKWLTNLARFSVLSGSFALLAGSLLGIIIKFLHNQIEKPEKNQERDQYPKIFKGIKQIKSRFNTKADKHSFFNPDLKMAS